MEAFIHIPFLSILITILAGLIIPLFKCTRIAKKITMVSFFIVILFSLLLIFYLNGSNQGYFTYQLGHYTAPWANELRASFFEAILSLVLSFIMLLSVAGGSKSISLDIKEDKEKYYYLILNLLLASILALIYTNDIFTAYVFIEINAVAACAIVVINDTKDSIKATIKYFVMSVLGSGIYLFAISTLYSITGHLAMSNIHNAIVNMPESYYIPLATSLVLIIVGLAVKSALFPFHTWLPDAHGSATSSASAILSSVVLKGYIILLIKILYRVYGYDILIELNILPIILILGILGMILGSVFALVQKDLKKMVAYSSVAQIGYIYLGIGLGTEYGVAAALFHIIVHGLTKSLLFISGGNLLEITGSKKIEDLNGVAHIDPISGIGFVVGGLSMIGVPLFSGFISKILFINSALDSSLAIVVIIGLAISTLLNAMYYIPVSLRLFDKRNMNKNLERSFKAEGMGKYSLIILIFTNILLGFLSKPLVSALIEGFKSIG
ncbi:MAG: sodium:proton antiporter [Tissierella sp.]|nr:sodium:proton antiporter [Tissierella sp.]